MADTEYAEIFREESGELLEELETSLLELEKDPADLKIVSRVFRAMHTIKGSGAMFGFDDIAGFTHHVETALDKVRDGSVPVSKNSVAIIAGAKETIRTGDSRFSFRQNSDFYYLTGFHEPDAIAVFHTMNSLGEYILFSRSASPMRA